VKERAMAAITDEQLREEVERIVLACLPDPLARLSERGCEPPYEMALLDRDGTAATGLIDENGESELAFNRIPELPFTLTLVDHERMRGERIEVCKTS
jgi:hypothetical protein